MKATTDLGLGGFQAHSMRIDDAPGNTHEERCDYILGYVQGSSNSLATAQQAAEAHGLSSIIVEAYNSGYAHGQKVRKGQESAPSWCS